MKKIVNVHYSALTLTFVGAQSNNKWSVPKYGLPRRGLRSADQAMRK